MKIEDIEIGKRYWRRLFGDCEVCTVIAKAENHVLVKFSWCDDGKCWAVDPGWILCEAKEPESKPKTFWQWLFGS